MAEWWLTELAAAGRDFGQLMLGHSRRYRTAQLQDVVTAALRHPSWTRSWVVPAVNRTIQGRQLLHRTLWLAPRRILSRVAVHRRLRRSDAEVVQRKISVLCPTRERPAGLARLVRSMTLTARAPGRIEVLCYVDSDDRQIDQYRAMAKSAERNGRCRLVLIVGEPVGVPASWNVLAAAATGDLLVMANDDQLYVDYGWDGALDQITADLTAGHPDGVYCLYFDGGQYPEGGCDFPIVSRAWYEALGYFSTEIFQQWQAERWIFDIARRIERLHPVPGVFVDHLHYQDYKAPFDATYQRHRLTREKSFADQAMFIRAGTEREREADRLRRFILDHPMPQGGIAMQNEATPVAEEIGARPYLTQAARRYYGSLIDAWHYGGRTDDANACAELAVAQGVWDHPLQRAREHIPGLSAQPLHDPANFWFASYLEEHYPQIRAEIEHVLDSSIDPVRPTTDDGALIRRGEWKQAHLFRDGKWQEDVCRHFPITRAILAEVPELTTFSPGVITVSRVEPGSHIMPHCGPTNALLRVHLAIKIPPGVWIKVAGQKMVWEEGKCLVFDDSFEHEVAHEGTEDRVVLILDTLHPDLGGDHRDRLLQRRLTTEEQIVAFMREGGFARVEVRDGEVLIHPQATVCDTVLGYMESTGIEGAQLQGDQVVWHQRSAEG